MTEDEMAGWHHRLDGHEFELTLGVGDGQGGLVCCSPWGRRVRHTLVTKSPQVSLSFAISQSLLKLMSIESVMPSNYLILCCPLLLLLPSQHQGLSSKSALHIRWLKYWRFHFSISPSNEDSGLIYFRMDWFDLPAVQGTLKSLLQHHSSKASVLLCSAFFMVQLSHAYMTTRKP